MFIEGDETDGYYVWTNESGRAVWRGQLSPWFHKWADAAEFLEKYEEELS